MVRHPDTAEEVPHHQPEVAHRMTGVLRTTEAHRMTEVHRTAEVLHTITAAAAHIHPEVHHTAAEVHRHQVVIAEAEVQPAEDTEDKLLTTIS